MSDLSSSVIASLKVVIGERSTPLHEPRFTGTESELVLDCIDSTFVSSVGKYVDRFEQELADFCGVERAIAVTNGTAALSLAYRLAGVRSDDEVVMPAMTFVATANAACHLGAVPHFVDAHPETLGLDLDKLRAWLGDIAELAQGHCRNRKTGRRIGAIVPMHTFGHMCDMPALLEIAAEFRIPVIEDAAEALGSRLDGQHAGSFGMCGTLSFNGNKTITTGGGGAILTNDLKLADYAKHLSTTAKVPHSWKYIHDDIGYNYRMPNINAALGCAQLQKLEEFVSSKRRLFEAYRSAFAGVEGLDLFCEPSGSQSNYWLQTLVLHEGGEGERDAILEATNEVGYMTRPVWELMDQLTMFSACPAAPLETANSLCRRIVNIPSSAGLA